MRYRLICLYLLFTLQGNVFGFQPIFRNEFNIENKTRENILVVFETIGLLGANLRYYYDEENYYTFSFSGGVNAHDKYFRTIRPRKLYRIGECVYNIDRQNFNEKAPKEKFKAFFKFILIFNDKGDLLYRIDDFDKCKIENRAKDFGVDYGVYVLIIE